MNFMKIRYLDFIVIVIIAIGLFSTSTLYAGIEWKEFRKIPLTKEPIDIAVSINGSWIYVLQVDSSILVYSSGGILFDTLKMSKEITAIEAGPNDDSLILSYKDKEVSVISLEYIRDINIEGSPFKGNKDAPVTIVVFMDFQ
ncbi:MAG: hypothetical protein HQK69_11265 [Desulfamplus sp.]|nr:hypothetical protein [Desulfamplus sp.]